MVYNKTIEETLDPENWDELRALGHKMLDDMIDRQQNISKLPLKFAPPEAVKDICVPLSAEGEGEEQTYRVFQRSIEPYGGFNRKPRFWGVVAGTGSPLGMLAGMLTAGYKTYAEQAPAVSGYVHKQVIEWIKELLDYPKEAGGVLVSGGSEANFTGLAVARNAKAKQDMKAKGIQGLSEKMTLYGSEEMHHCTERSVELLGLGNEALRWLPTDDEYRIKIRSLRKAISDDRARGMHPFCIIGNAGTVNCGAFDDFKTLRSIADKENM